MTEDPQSLILLALILCTGVFIQAAAGFAGGLFIVPTMLLCGYSIPVAQCSMLVATVPQNAWGLWMLRTSNPLRGTLMPALGRLAFLPIGILVLSMIDSWPTDVLRQIVGGLVLLATMTMIYLHPEPRDRIHPGWSFVAFPVSGFFQGLVGVGGPAMALWLQAHNWSTARTRGFLFAMFLLSTPPALALLYVAFGDRIVAPGIVAAATTPLLLLVTSIGVRFGTWLGRERLRRITLGLLILTGLAGVAAPLVRGGL